MAETSPIETIFEIDTWDIRAAVLRDLLTYEGLLTEAGFRPVRRIEETPWLVAVAAGGPRAQEAADPR